jgi:hypothetical protein
MTGNCIWIYHLFLDDGSHLLLMGLEPCLWPKGIESLTLREGRRLNHAQQILKRFVGQDRSDKSRRFDLLACLIPAALDGQMRLQLTPRPQRRQLA